MRIDHPPPFSILIPVLNEEELLERSLKKLESFLSEQGIAAEILILDNGSTDRTEEIGRAAKNERIRYFRLPERGPGRAFQLGVKEATGEYLITLDADLSSDLSFVKHASLLLPHVDAVVGAKTFGHQRRTLFRVLGSQTFILCSQFLFDIPIADFSMGSKAFRRKDVLPIVENLDHWTGYILEIVLFLALRKKQIIQISVDCDDTRQSRFNLLHEAQYRFRHLWRMRELIRKKHSWIAAS